jgi:hypothetical protein
VKLFAAIYLVLVAAENAAGAAPYGYRFMRTGDDPAQILYDRTGDRFFVSVPGKNEIEVVAAGSGKIVSRINAMSPYALDLSPDGATIYVTCYVVPWGRPRESSRSTRPRCRSTDSCSRWSPPSVVLWNGAGQATTFVSSSHLIAQIRAADVAAAGTATVSVSSPAADGGPSITVSFTIVAGNH